MALKLQRHEVIAVLGSMKAAEKGKLSDMMSVQFRGLKGRVIKYLRKTGTVPDELKGYAEKSNG